MILRLYHLLSIWHKICSDLLEGPLWRNKILCVCMCVRHVCVCVCVYVCTKDNSQQEEQTDGQTDRQTDWVHFLNERCHRRSQRSLHNITHLYQGEIQLD